jgi:hypothetical protein
MPKGKHTQCTCLYSVIESDILELKIVTCAMMNLELEHKLSRIFLINSKHHERAIMLA